MKGFDSDHIDAQLTAEVIPLSGSPSAGNQSLTLLKGLRREQEWADVVGARYNTADREKKERLDLQVMPLSGCQVKVLFGKTECCLHVAIEHTQKTFGLPADTVIK